MSRLWDDRIFPFLVCILLAYFVLQEYRDHGWGGVVFILVGGLVLYAILHAGVELLVRRERRKNEGQ